MTTNNSAAAGGPPIDVAWRSIFAGAIAATALSSVLLAFGAAIGLSVSSASPSWRDASAALALLSGFFLLIEAALSFGLGGYIAGRTRRPVAAPASDVERSDGVHGLLAWAAAIIAGLIIAALVSGLSPSTKAASTISSQPNVAEPLLSYELDRLFRAPRRPANVDLTQERQEAGRILLTSAGHSGVSADDRTYLVQEVSALTGLTGPDADRRVDDTISRSQSAIHNSRRTGVILAFSLAAALLLGSVISWSAAVAGGRHRDGEPLPRWMTHGDYLTRRRATPAHATAEPTVRPLPE